MPEVPVPTNPSLAESIIAFLTDLEPITQIPDHIGEPTSPPADPPRQRPSPDRAPDGPQMGPLGHGGGQKEEVAQESFPDDLDQSSEFDPIPEDDFD